jgi:hypothetical protein
MPNENIDLFDTTTGLYEGPAVMTNVRFDFPSTYDNGNTLIMVADLDTEDADTGIIEDQLFGIGKGWDRKDKGQRIEKVKGRPLYNDSSGLGMIMAGATKGLPKVYKDEAEYPGHKIRNAEAFVEEGRKRIDQGLTPQHADFWNGLRFEFARVEIAYGGEIGTRDKLIVAEFLGTKDKGSKAAPKAEDVEAKPAEAAPAEAAPTDEVTTRRRKKADAGGGLTEAVKDQIKAVADKVIGEAPETMGDDELFATYVEQAIEAIDGAESDATIQAAIEDDSDDSLWGEVLSTYGPA